MKAVVLLTIIAIAAALLPGPWLELQRGGEPWRIVTCHFTHWTYEQLAWDGLVFAALGVACARRNRAAFHATLLASIIAIPIAVLAFAPGVSSYRGLSGIDSALFGLLLVIDSRLRPSAFHLLIGAAFFAKITFELIASTTLFVQNMGPGIVPVPVAHVAGALIGVAIGTLFQWPLTMRSSSRSSVMTMRSARPS